MTALVEEVAAEQAERLSAVALLPVAGGRQRDVDAGMPVVGVVLLRVHDDPDQLAVRLDGERHRLRVVEEIAPHSPLVVLAPPADDLGLLQDLDHARHVGALERA